MQCDCCHVCQILKVCKESSFFVGVFLCVSRAHFLASPGQAASGKGERHHGQGSGRKRMKCCIFSQNVLGQFILVGILAGGLASSCALYLTETIYYLFYDLRIKSRITCFSHIFAKICCKIYFSFSLDNQSFIPILKLWFSLFFVKKNCNQLAKSRNGNVTRLHFHYFDFDLQKKQA